jgi:sulfate adenylyltransferase subunit 1
VTDLLRLATAGSVDDGKSTLIGRLLYDAKAVLADQLEHVEMVNARRGGEGPDLALLTDGLRAEREQGITIDVAYRHFATPRRRFILADTPGHAQYTRNMVTGASTAELAIVLVDVRNGVTEQSRRHAAVAKLLGIRHITVAVNKMDLVDFAEEAFDGVVRQFLDLAALLDVHDITFIPMSALLGDNVVERSEHMPWYDGPPLLEHLETVPLDRSERDEPARLPVQTVLRAGERHYAGRLAAGTMRPGDEVVVLPAGTRSTVTAVELPEGEVAEASAPASVAVRLADELDVGRGDLIAAADRAPEPRRELSAEVCWLGDEPVSPRARLLLKHTTRTVRARVDAIEGKLDLTSLDWAPAGTLALNDVGRVRLRLGEEVMAEPYDRVRAMGAFILIDESTNDTVGAGMVR